MDRIILDPAVLEQLGQFATGVKVCDSEGRVLGFFTPAEESSHENIQMRQGVSELKRRENESPGRALKDILDDLEKPN